MATYSTVNLDGNIDLNSLFNLTYNFDLLKGVIDALVKSQKSTNQKLIDIEEKVTDKDKIINE
jgi:hypothetical protein